MIPTSFLISFRFYQEEDGLSKRLHPGGLSLMSFWIPNETLGGLNTSKEGQNKLALSCAQNPLNPYGSIAIISKSNTSTAILLELILLMDTENLVLHYLIV